MSSPEIAVTSILLTLRLKDDRIAKGICSEMLVSTGNSRGIEADVSICPTSRCPHHIFC